MMVIATHCQLNIMSADISNVFLTAPCAEWVWSSCGKEFGNKHGATVVIKRALYGLKTSARSYHEHFADFLRMMGFTPTRADQDVWWKDGVDHDGYDFICTHVDDILIEAKNPSRYMSQIEQKFALRNIEYNPSYYLGSELKIKNGNKHVSCGKYITEALSIYQTKHGTIKKQNIPITPDSHPELDDSTPLNTDGIKRFQQTIGMCQWIITAGRFDIQYTTTSLRRFTTNPQQNHLKMAEQILGYLKSTKSEDIQ